MGGKHTRIVSWDSNPKPPCHKCGEHSQYATSTVPGNSQNTEEGHPGIRTSGLLPQVW
jgi:hypothetical protein